MNPEMMPVSDREEKAFQREHQFVKTIGRVDIWLRGASYRLFLTKNGTRYMVLRTFSNKQVVDAARSL